MSFRAFMQRVSPHLDYPDHLLPILQQFDPERFEDGKTTISVPPQSGKTTVILHILAYIALHSDTAETCIFATYSATKAKREQTVFREICERAGEDVGRGNSEITVKRNGFKVLFTSVQGGATGYPASLLFIIDDPIKNRQEALSATVREKIYDWYTSVALTRVHPGASQFCIMTRWHPDDLSGRLLSNGDWREVNIPAITPDGRSYWEKRRSLVFLLGRKKDLQSHDWDAMYQGEPQSTGIQLFKKCLRIDSIPDKIAKTSVGVDFAYNRQNSRDYCAICVMHTDGVRFYIEIGQLFREDLTTFLGRLKSFGILQVWAKLGNNEKPLAGMIETFEKLSIRWMPGNVDKIIAAQPLAREWARNRVLVGPQVNAQFVRQIESFDGTPGNNDDGLDAAVAAHFGLMVNDLDPTDYIGKFKVNY